MEERDELLTSVLGNIAPHEVRKDLMVIWPAARSTRGGRRRGWGSVEGKVLNFALGSVHEKRRSWLSCPVTPYEGYEGEGLRDERRATRPYLNRCRLK